MPIDSGMVWLQAKGFDPMNFVFIGALLFIMYFFLIRPQTKAQQDQRKMQEGLTRGDRVVTAGGLLGVVTSADKEVVTIEVGHLKGEKMRVQVERARIERKVEPTKGGDKGEKGGKGKEGAE